MRCGAGFNGPLKPCTIKTKAVYRITRIRVPPAVLSTLHTKFSYAVAKTLLYIIGVHENGKYGNLVKQIINFWSKVFIAPNFETI